MADDISPLAQRLAEAYDVDLAKLKEKHLGGKITARNVLDYLNAADGNISKNRISENGTPENRDSEDGAPKKSLLKNRASAGRKAPVTPTELTPADLAPTDEKAAPKKETNQEKPVQKERKEQPKQQELDQKEPEQENPVQPAPLAPTQDSAEAVAALAKARAQLQVTAKVHQQALMQVGSLREQNTLLEAELTLLREAEAQTRSQLEGFQKHNEPLEVEVEPAKKRRAFAWLRKLFS